ncbi:MAG TPA: SGNH/GDSL hydrolase family protein [Burkholderiaceae bacterium]|nr:SGNH/GDSL hydrolase family protein [Burkholderiaceae bacterium]
MLANAARIALGPILYAQARRLRAIALELPEPRGARKGVEGSGTPGLRLLVAGDSSAAGVGADTQDEALALPLARDVAGRLNGSVSWQLVARTGVTSQALLQLLQDEDVAPADVAVVVVGVNDLTNEVPLRRALRWRLAIAQWLRARDVTHVLFTSMPEMQNFPLIPQPLAWYVGLQARRNNRAQARWAPSASGVAHVDLDGMTRADWMARDGYHPAPKLYGQLARRLGAVIAERVRARPAARRICDIGRRT